MSTITTKKTLLYIVSLILGLTFLFSAFAKTQPITPFVNLIYEKFLLTYQASSIIAKGLIGLEAGLGILFIINLFGKWRWVLHTSLVLLLTFTAYIAYLWITEGSEADCGCMGDFVKLSPLWSIVKNVIMMALVLVLIIFDKRQETKNRTLFAWIIAIIFLCYPFLFFPTHLNIDAMYEEQYLGDNPPAPNDIREGKHIVAFLSFTCPHCIEAAIKFGNMYHEDPSMPIIFIFAKKENQDPGEVEAFEEATGTSTIMKHFIDLELFRDLAGNGVPSIYLLDDSEIADKVDNYKKMELKTLQKWYKD